MTSAMRNKFAPPTNACFCLVCIYTLLPDAVSAAELTAEVLQEEKASIGEIRIINNNIFDPEDDQENRRLYRWANAIHIKTRPETIASQLLFESGDTYQIQIIEESERLLRSNRYLHEAQVIPRKYANGVVDLDVVTTDVWTLSPSLSFGRGGGENSGGFGLKEYNLLGRGATIGIAYKSNVDRDTTIFKYNDRNLFGSRYEIFADYSDSSDGFSQGLDLGVPFYELDAQRAKRISLNSGRQTLSLYDRGNISSQFEHRYEHHEILGGRSNGLQGDWARRYLAGVAYDAHEYGLAPDNIHPMSAVPLDRTFIYPFVGIEFLQNDFETTRDLDQMNRTEDRHMGKRFGFRIGYAPTGLGSTDNTWMLNGNFGSTLLRSKKSSAMLDAEFHGRVENGTGRNLKLTMSARYDHRQSEKRLLHAQVTTTLGHNLDIDDPTYLGGDNGLRGYPLRYQGGDKSVLVTLEQRLFTDWYPFRLFNIGGAIFFDAGRTWGPDPENAENLGWLRDIGFGLRIGNTRSGIGRMIHIDVAYPLDGESDISSVQILIEAKKSF